MKSNKSNAKPLTLLSKAKQWMCLELICEIHFLFLESADAYKTFECPLVPSPGAWRNRLSSNQQTIFQTMDDVLLFQKRLWVLRQVKSV